jgi:hypothetical protein
LKSGSSEVERPVPAFIEACVAIGDKEASMEQFADVLTVPEKMVTGLHVEDSIESKHLCKLVFDVFTKRGEPSIDDPLFMIGAWIRFHDTCQRRKNTISIYRRIDRIAIPVIKRLQQSPQVVI